MAAAFGTALLGAVTAASAAVVAFGKASVKAGSAFDSSMSQVAATMGFTIDELNDANSSASQTMDTLRNFAQEMGSSTAFSATQAADALNYMALAGYDADKSMEMLPTVLNLAAAGGMDLAAASDMVTDAQTALGLSMEETATMTDQMAAAASSSNTSVSQLGEAFLTIGGTAKGLAGGTQELATMFGVLADNGIKGSEAGTHLRNIMLALGEHSKDLAKDFDVDVYDKTTGEMRDMASIMTELSAAMDGMTTGEKTEVLNDMFRVTDLAAVNALLDTSAERYEELSDKIGDSAGAAQAMADVQLDNLAGDMTLFKSALEGAQIAVSDGLTPSLREFVQFGTKSISTLTDAYKKGGVEGLMSSLGGILSQGIGMITKMLPKIVSAGIKLLDALMQGMMENIPMLLAAAIEIVTMLGQYIAESLPTMIPQIVMLITAIVETLISNAPMLLEVGIQILLALIQGIIEAIPMLIAEMPRLISEAYAAISSALPTMLQAGLDIIGKIIEGIAAAFGSLRENGKAIVNSIKEGIASVWDSVVSWFKGLVSMLTGTAHVNVSYGGDGFSDPGHPTRHFASGAQTVPYDGMIASLHQGEMILNRTEADAYRRGDSGNGSSVNIYAQSIDEATVDYILQRVNAGLVGA